MRLLLITLAFLLAAYAGPALATTFGGFEIDGDLDPGTDSPPGDDWGNAPNLAIGIDELFGQDDDSFNNIKENTIPDNFDDRSGDPNVEVTTGGIPPNKSDFTRFYVANRNFAGDGDEYLYLAWQRTLDSGSATMDFELSQSDALYVETGLPVRSIGDLLITYNFSGNGSLTVEFREWEGSSWGSAIDLSDAGFAAAAINAAGVVDPISGDALSPNTIGELGINLTESGIIPTDECINFGSAHVKSRSSPSFSSSMKDFVAPIDVNIGNCGFEIAKTGNTDLSKVGDDVVYTFTVTNTGNPGSPTLVLESIVDDVIGDLSADAVAAGLDELDQGESASFTITYTVQVDDPDPLVNTVSATYVDAGSFSQTDSASHSVNLFQPAIAIDLDGDALSKVGDPVAYTITVTNGSSADSPNLAGTVTDPFDGAPIDIDLAAGDSFVKSGTYVVQPSDDDPFTRTASVIASPIGFPNVLEDSDDHSVNLFQPAIAIDLDGDALSKVGDPVAYTITVTNGSSADSPNLAGTVTDPYEGSTTQIELAAGEVFTTTGSYIVQPSDSDPFTRNAAVTVSPLGFPNVLTDSDDHTVNLFQPSLAAEKSGPAEASVGDAVTYTIVLTNTSSPDTPDLVDPVVVDSLVDLGAAVESIATNGRMEVGETWTYSTVRTVELTDPDPLINTVSALFNPDAFPNEITASASHSLDVLQPVLQIVKTPDMQIIGPGDTATFEIVVTNVGDGRAIDVLLEDTLPTPRLGGDLSPLTWTVDALPGQEFEGGDSFSVELGDLEPGASANVSVSAAIPADYLDAAGVPDGPGTLGSSFEIDGNLVEDGFDTLDWVSLLGSPDFANQPDRFSGQDDDAFGQGSKENTNPPRVVTGSIPNNKSDLTNFLFNQEVVEGNVFLEVGFIRANTLGTANMDFEMNQSTAISENGVTPERSVGDILLSYDFASGGNLVELSLREWNGSAWVNEIDLDAAAAAQGAVNNGFTVGNPLGEPDPLADKTFGEAVVNLTQVFGDDCRRFASAYVKSRSSASFTSALKDFIEPISVGIDTCRTISLPNTASADAINHVGPVSDDGLISVTNDPGLKSVVEAGPRTPSRRGKDKARGALGRGNGRR